MVKVEIYTTKTCPYCIYAKDLLARKNIHNIQEIDVSDDEELRAGMIERAKGIRTVPQIFINDKHIGGFDDMNLLDQQGELDKLLSL